MEDEHGNPIPKLRRAAVRKTAKGFFHLILEMGRAPAAWGDVSLDIDNELIHRLESEHEFLRLCDNHWKARQVATNSYSQWHLGAPARRAAALAKQAAEESERAGGTEVIDVDSDDVNNDDANQDKPPKRPRAEDNETRRPKRPRVEGTESTPPRPTRVAPHRQRVCELFYYDYMRR